MSDTDTYLRPHTEYLSVLAFENRSPQDKKAALARISDGKAFDARTDETPQAAFEKDVRLISHSPAFRRLGKQTMLAPSNSPAFQNRLSHSLTVADTGVQIAEALQLGSASKELVRAIALAHDIGHPPFSHEGEEAINKRLLRFGIRWDHDKAVMDVLQEHSLHGLDYLGLPLTAATMEGIRTRHHHQKNDPLGKRQYNHIEGQIAATSDWIAATVTDIQDMMTMKMASNEAEKETKAFLDNLSTHFPLVRDVVSEINEQFNNQVRTSSPQQRSQWKSDLSQRTPVMVTALCDRLRDRLVEDVVNNSRQRLTKYHERIQHAEDVRDLPELLLTPSPELHQQLENLKDYYHREVYPEIAHSHLNTAALVGRVFDDFASGDVQMPESWNDAYRNIQSSNADTREKAKDTAVLVAKYLTTNMTDADILWHLKNHHPEEAKELLKAACEAPHPTMPYPENIRGR